LQSLAYKKVQHVPLYLEWAPRDIFSSPAPERPLSQPNGSKAAGSRNAGQAAAAGTAKAKSIKAAPVAPAKSEAAAGGGGEGEEGEGEGATIYVKNLAFATTDAALKKHFDKVTEPGVHDLQLPCPALHRHCACLALSSSCVLAWGMWSSVT
jgi:multiple RNA-binding domain-containing protein 1